MIFYVTAAIVKNLISAYPGKRSAIFLKSFSINGSSRRENVI
jgi:hypothetical protein